MRTAFLIPAVLLLASDLPCPAATTIDVANKNSYGANLGWMDWRGDTTNGAIIGEYVCSGSIYSANVGWINLGSGSPANLIYYGNVAANDFGVNHDGFGNLRGYAYGANIGWIVFEDSGAPRVNLKTGALSGYAYSANCGWISLTNTTAFVQTDLIAPGADTDGDGMADAWELLHFGSLAAAPNADADGDGVSNLAEYRAGTDPLNTADYLHITSIAALSPGNSVSLAWTSVSNRSYYVEERLDILNAPAWFDSGLGAIDSGGLSTARIVANTNAPMRFYRIEAFRPLGP